MPGIIYGNVNSSAAKEIVEKHVIGGKIADGLTVLERPAADILKA